MKAGQFDVIAVLISSRGPTMSAARSAGGWYRANTRSRRV